MIWDGNNRVIPVLANDAAAFKSPPLGIWFYGVENFKCPFVWAHCARFFFCKNFEEPKMSISNNKNSFVVVSFGKAP